MPDSDASTARAIVPERDTSLPPLVSPPLFAPADRRILAALCIAAFLAALNFFATTPFYPDIARDLHTTIPLLGQVVTLMVLISAGLGLTVGPLADRYGYRWPLVCGLLAMTINLMGTGMAPSYPVLLGLGVLGGLADALVFALPLAIAATHFTGAAQRRAIGWTIGALSSASIIGVPILTAIGGVAGWRAALVVAGLSGAGAAWFVAVALPPDGRHPTTRLRLRSIFGAYAPILRHAPSLRLFGVAALRAVWWLGLLTYLGAFLGETLVLTARQIGLVYALGGGAYAVGSFAIGARLGAVSPRTVVAVSCAFGVLVAPTLLVANVWVAVPLLLIISLAAAVCSVGIAALLGAESPAGAGTTMVLNGSLLNLGGAGGAALGGLLIAVGGYSALGIGLPLFAVGGAILVGWPEDGRSAHRRPSTRRA